MFFILTNRITAHLEKHRFYLFVQETNYTEKIIEIYYISALGAMENNWKKTIRLFRMNYYRWLNHPTYTASAGHSRLSLANGGTFLH